MSQPYDFEAFLLRMAELGDYVKILQAAKEACHRAEQASVGQGDSHQRQAGSGEYVQRIKQFLHFMQHTSRPHGVSDRDFAAYRPIVQSLVNKRWFKASALKLFDPPQRKARRKLVLTGTLEAREGKGGKIAVQFVPDALPADLADFGFALTLAEALQAGKAQIMVDFRPTLWTVS
jgi:hypothetical protein